MLDQYLNTGSGDLNTGWERAAHLYGQCRKPSRNNPYIINSILYHYKGDMDEGEASRDGDYNTHTPTIPTPNISGSKAEQKVAMLRKRKAERQARSKEEAEEKAAAAVQKAAGAFAHSATSGITQLAAATFIQKTLRGKIVCCPAAAVTAVERHALDRRHRDRHLYRGARRTVEGAAYIRLGIARGQGDDLEVARAVRLDEAFGVHLDLAPRARVVQHRRVLDDVTLGITHHRGQLR